ncbi:MAG TPA: ABC transporter ATP-binding protein [Mesorhizobium sp.]|jgi:lipopolysaccharide transport system ATP-binding protein|nr:ABC transporter ATP-binding protein [Mesorhizobium sp.]
MSSEEFVPVADTRRDEFAIRVREVSKHYAMFDRPEDRFKQMSVPRLQRLIGREPRRYYRDFAALSGVSLEVRRGETVGIVGRNGSGKSTLLQIICGTLQPTGGTVEVHGRIAALLELGAGFNPEFTGRENVFLNASILGVPRQEMEWRYDEIARFADIGPFIEHPVKTYSSGMYVRLAFATAINVDPDILVVDEALAVGDEAFQRKCFARIEQIKERGGTILFVSHGAQSIVQLCTRAVLIDRGEKILEGRPKAVVSQYQRLINLSGEQALAAREEIRALGVLAVPPTPTGEAAAPEGKPGAVAAQAAQAPPRDSGMERFDPNFLPQSTVVYESHGAIISNPRLLNSRGEPVNTIEIGREYTYTFNVRFQVDARDVGFGMMVSTTNGLALAGAGTGLSPSTKLKAAAKDSVYVVNFRFICSFLPGTYVLNAGVMGATDEHQGFLHRILDAAIIKVAPVPDMIATGLVDAHITPAVQRVS